LDQIADLDYKDDFDQKAVSNGENLQKLANLESNRGSAPSQQQLPLDVDIK